MAFNLHITGSGTRSPSAHVSRVFEFLSRVGSKTASTLRSLLKTLQTARMMSILAGMSDQQLADIGISRSDIPRYAERLMSNEQKG